MTSEKPVLKWVTGATGVLGLAEEEISLKVS